MRSKMREHFEAMAHELDVDIVLVFDFDYPNEAWGQAIDHPVHEGRRVVVLSKPPTTPLAYVVAMHELGHCVPGSGWSANNFLDREAGAWEWAWENFRYMTQREFASYALDYMTASMKTKGVVPSSEFNRVRRKLRRIRRQP